MFHEWMAIFLEVCKFWWNAFLEAFFKAWGFVGQTKEGIVFTVLVVLVFAVWLHARHGWRGMTEKIWEKILEGLAVTVLAFVLVLLWKLSSEPWSEVSSAMQQFECIAAQ